MVLCEQMNAMGFMGGKKGEIGQFACTRSIANNHHSHGAHKTRPSDCTQTFWIDEMQRNWAKENKTEQSWTGLD